MNINLLEHELKQAIEEYLAKRLVEEIESTEIALTAGRTPNGMTASVDIKFAGYKQIEVITTLSPESTPTKTVATSKPVTKKTSAPAKVAETTPDVSHKEIVKEVAEDLNAVDAFGTSITPVAETTAEEALIVEGGNTMTKNFELTEATPKVAAPIVDDVEDLFNC